MNQSPAALKRETEQFIRDRENVLKLPDPTISNLKTASQDILAEEVITLRMFVASLYREYQDLARDYTELQKTVRSQADAFTLFLSNHSRNHEEV